MVVEDEEIAPTFGADHQRVMRREIDGAGDPRLLRSHGTGGSMLIVLALIRNGDQM